MQNDENMSYTNDVQINLPNMSNPQQQQDLNSYNANNNGLINNDRSGLMNMGPFGNHYGIDSTAGSIAGTGIGNIGDLDNKSLTSTPSKISKFTYSGEFFFNPLSTTVFRNVKFYRLNTIL